jgi:stage II sporulation protein AA (anti-sigma F factor antagonist)
MQKGPTDTPVFEIASERDPEGVFIVHVRGELDMSHEQELRAQLTRGIAESKGGIVVDLTGCEFIDSSGVRALLLGRQAQGAEGDGGPGLVIASDSAQIVRILSVMGVDEAIPVHPSVEDATAALQD